MPKYTGWIGCGEELGQSMSLPDNCEIVDGYLVFWELAEPSLLDDHERLYEYVCFNACTNGLRPGGTHEVTQYPLPELPPDQVLVWGGRTLRPADAQRYRDQGMVLARIALPVSSMGPPTTVLGSERPSPEDPSGERVGRGAPADFCSGP